MAFTVSGIKVPAGHMGDVERPAQFEVYGEGASGSGEGMFEVRIKAALGQMVAAMWATEEGLTAIRDACSEALIRSRIEREQAARSETKAEPEPVATL